MACYMDVYIRHFDKVSGDKSVCVWGGIKVDDC